MAKITARVTGKGAGPIGCLLIIAVIFGMIASFGWIIMLGFGVIHSFDSGWPPLAFWPATGIGFLLTAFLGMVRPS